MNRKQCFYLIDRELTEQDLKDMQRWVAIRDAELQRIVRVLAYWSMQPIKCGGQSLK